MSLNACFRLLNNKRIVLAAVFDSSFAMTGLLAFYMLVMRVFAGSWDAGFEQFQALQPYVSLLMISFGAAHAIGRLSVRLMSAHVAASSKMSTTNSSISMTLCCLHYLTDVTPLLGVFGGTVAILASYQKLFLVFGAAVNLGIISLAIRRLSITQNNTF